MNGLEWYWDGSGWFAEAGPLFKLSCWQYSFSEGWTWQVGVPGYVPLRDPDLRHPCLTADEAKATAEHALIKILFHTTLAFGMDETDAATDT